MGNRVREYKKAVKDVLTERIRNHEERLRACREDNVVALRAFPRRAPSNPKTSDSSQRKDTDKSKNFATRRCYNCGQRGHIAVKCEAKRKEGDEITKKRNRYPRSAGSEPSGNVMAFSSDISTVRADAWIADSACSQHMTSNRANFAEFVTLKVPVSITGIGETKLLAYGIGRVRVRAKVQKTYYMRDLVNVFYVPELCGNLFSTVEARKHGCDTLFLANGLCIIKKNGQVVASGKAISNGLTVLDVEVMKLATPIAVSLASARESLQVLHERMVHQNKRHVVKFLNQNGLQVDTKEEFCEGCVRGKMHRKHFGSRTVRALDRGEQINADIIGPMSEKSIGGSRYALILKDDYTRFRKIFCLKTKSEASKCIETFLNEAKTAGIQIKTLLCDAGTEFINQSVKDILSRFGVRLRVSMTETPQQNGAAERENRTVIEAARAMLTHKGLPTMLWAEACNTAVFVLNRTAPTPVSGKTPIELWYQEDNHFDINRLKIFGTKVWYLLPQRHRREKFGSKSRCGLLVGYEGCDGYRIYVSGSRDVVRSCNVKFEQETSYVEVCQENVQTPFLQKPTESKTLEDNDDSKQGNKTEEKGALEAGQTSSRPKRQCKLPSRLNDYVVDIPVKTNLRDCAYYAFIASGAPTTYEEAVSSEDAVLWKAAMADEINSQMENETWQLVSLPEGKSLLKNRWVFRLKLKSDGKIDKAKARLVVKGCAQKPGVDYDEIYSPVARYDTVRVLLSVAAAHNLDLYQFDIKTAFLYGEVEEELYMAQPQGFEDGTDRVCRLRKSVYGLKQAPRCWSKRFRTFLLTNGFRESDADPCLFMSIRDGRRLFLAVYVDDGMVVGDDRKDIDKLILDLKTEFKITEGQLDSFLGIHIERTRSGIFINQPAYTENIIKRFRMENAKPTSVPTGIIEKEEDSTKLDSNVPYRQAVGCLQYLAIVTRPDIAFAVSTVARAVTNPSKSDWRRVHKIYRYLNGTRDVGIMYRKEERNQFATFSDADYAGDWITGRSTTGLVSLYACGAVVWSSRQQRSVALSSTEAEYMAASDGAKDCVWLSKLFKSLTGFEECPVLFCDNQSAIALSKNSSFHQRTKHINVRYHFIRDLCDRGKLCLKYVETTRQLADIFTKHIRSNAHFLQLRGQLGMVHRHQLEEEC